MGARGLPTQISLTLKDDKEVTVKFLKSTYTADDYLMLMLVSSDVIPSTIFLATSHIFSSSLVYASGAPYY